MEQQFQNEKAFQRYAIQQIVQVSEKDMYDNLAEWVVNEKKRQARVLHVIYGIAIILLLIILSQAQ